MTHDARDTRVLLLDRLQEVLRGSQPRVGAVACTHGARTPSQESTKLTADRLVCAAARSVA